MAIEEIPPQSKYNYKLIVEDDQLLAAKAATAANKLINQEGVQAIISTWSYGGTVVAPLAERAHVIHFGIAWDPTVARGRYNFIHLTPPKTFLPQFLEIFERLGLRRIVTSAIAESGSQYCLDELERLTAGTKFKIIERDNINYGELDYRTLISKAEKKHPDVYFTNFGSAENDAFMQQAKELQVKAPITAITGFDVSENLPLLEGRWYVSDSIVPDDFANKFSARYHHQRLYGVGNYYDVIKLIVSRYEQTSGLELPSSESLLPHFADLSDFQSVFGRLRIDQAGVISYPAQCRRIQNGMRQTVPCAEIK